MRKIIYTTVTLALLTTLAGCDGYLSTVPKGEKIPTTLSDFEAFIRDEYTCHRTDVTQALILLNDRYVTDYYKSYYPLWAANYNWDESANRIDLNNSDEGCYYNGYAGISTCNLLLEYVPDATEGSNDEKVTLIAQAKVLRAMSYFNVANYYADTYVEATAASKGGIPIITSSAVNAPYTQPSLQSVYDFIINDISEAYTDLPDKSATILHPDKAAVDAFAARLYLQMGNYTEALKRAEAALGVHSALFNWVEYYAQYQSVIEDADDFSTRIPSPMGFDYVENYNYRHGTTQYSASENSLTIERAELFEEGDAKMATRWKYYSIAGEPYYKSNLNGYYNYGGMTTVEVMLIKAECLARAGKYSDAMKMVNDIRETRILPAYYIELKAATEAEAIAHIITLKRNELIMTIVPFIDIRRLNAEGVYTITLSKELGGATISLLPTSRMWTMPFPKGAVNNSGNGTITQNVEK